MVENYQTTVTGTRTASYDEGLRAYFRRVYNVMTIGLIVTGLVATITHMMLPTLIVSFGAGPVMLLSFVPLIITMFMFRGSVVMTKSAAQLNTRFYVFSALFGMGLAPITLVYTGGDIARAFFITAATFAATSAWSYATKADLSRFGSFLFMGVIGLLIAMVVNIFLGSARMDFIISCAGVLIYTGLVAYDTQQLKETYAVSSGTEANNKMAVMGAVSLYVNFINLFLFILRLLGNNRN